jgi:hypothetical protein
MASALLFVGNLPAGADDAGLSPASSAPNCSCRRRSAAEAAAFGVLALLADHFSLAAVVSVAAIDGALALTAKTLTRAVTAAMLEPEGELRAGNAVLNIAFTAGVAVGPAVAGGVVAAFGVQSALLLDAASFYLIAGSC